MSEPKRTPGVAVSGWLKGEPCIYDDADECPDIDCSHNAEPEHTPMTTLPCPRCRSSMGWPDDGSTPGSREVCDECERLLALRAFRTLLAFRDEVRQLREWGSHTTLAEIIDFVDQVDRALDKTKEIK